MQTNCRHFKFSDNEIGKYILHFVLIAVNNWVLKACQCQKINTSDSLTFCIYFDSVFWLSGQLSTQVQMSGFLSLLKKKPIIELHLLQKGLKTNNNILTEIHAVRKLLLRCNTDGICEIRYMSCPHGQLLSFHDQTLKAAPVSSRWRPRYFLDPRELQIRL